MNVEAKPSRRIGLSYADEGAVVADVQALRRGYSRAGNWTLPQVCWHLAAATRARMAPGPHPDTTPEQAARRAQLEQVLATGTLPGGLAAPDFMQPPADCDDVAIDRLVATLREFEAFPGPMAPHRLFGKQPDADMRRINLIHCAHHLSYLVPTPATRRADLSFASAADVIRDVEQLRRGYDRLGNWSLPQIAWHLGLPLHMCLHPLPADARSTPEQARLKADLLDALLASGRMPTGVPIAPGTDPLADAPAPIDAAEVDRLIDGLRRMDAFPHDRVMFGPFGVVTLDEFRRFNMLHAANHLGHLIPRGG